MSFFVIKRSIFIHSCITNLPTDLFYFFRCCRLRSHLDFHFPFITQVIPVIQLTGIPRPPLSSVNKTAYPYITIYCYYASILPSRRDPWLLSISSSVHSDCCLTCPVIGLVQSALNSHCLNCLADKFDVRFSWPVTGPLPAHARIRRVLLNGLFRTLCYCFLTVERIAKWTSSRY